MTQSLSAVLEGRNFYRGRNPLEENEDTLKGNFLLRELSARKFEFLTC